jgi:transglutaminase-like putative cysteine protease
VTRLTVQHTTLYRYRQPVHFGEHRLMFRPRDSHDLRLVDTALTISPRAEVRWMHDVFSNSIAIASFRNAASELRFDSRIRIEHFGLNDPGFPIAPFAQRYPFNYSDEELADLAPSMNSSHPDPEGRVAAWARAFLEGQETVETRDLLVRMTRAIRDRVTYETRYDIGVQAPAETLSRGAGSCRDLAVLMMDAVRALGFAAHFVSGYLYDPALDGGGGASEAALKGVGHTHAWARIYLPGAGWVEFDPTNGLVGGANLIRVAVAREPDQASPLQGSFTGLPEDFLDMEVSVKVSAD